MGVEGAASEAVNAAGAGGTSGVGHVAEPWVENAGGGHGGGAFVTPPGGGAQNGSVEKMWRREKCETKGEAPPQRERRPADSARVGTPPPVVSSSSSSFSLRYIISLSRSGVLLRDPPNSIGLHDCLRDHLPCSAFTACVVPISIKTKALMLEDGW